MKTCSYPFVDLSIVTFNSSEWIEIFFSSLLLQEYPIDRINVLIHDNGSVDDTVQKIDHQKLTCSKQFASFEISASGNIGFGAGHNANIALCASPYFLVSNVDIAFDADAIANAVRIAQVDADDVACWEFRQKPYEHPKLYNPVTLETTWSSSACVLFRREAIVAIGGYEAHLFMYGEDVEISYRLRDRGYRLRYCPKAVCWHYCYSKPRELKPTQFFGNILANALLRLRYGNVTTVLGLFVMFPTLWVMPYPVENKLKGLLKVTSNLIVKAPYFLLTRKKSSLKFSFMRWDYEEARDGAFYEFKKNLDCPPLVSVIVRTYKGRESILREAVQSILNQTYPNIELVIVEDGTEEARPFAEELKENKLLASVQYISIQKAGRCIAGNTGLEYSKGDYLAFLDDDDLLFADHFEVLVNELYSRNDIGAVYALAYEVGTEILSYSPLKYIEHSRQIFYRQKFSRPLLWYKNYIPIQSILFKKALYDQYGGFDVGLENLEDWHLWIRYSLVHDFLLINKTTSLYRVPAKIETATKRQEKLDDYYDVARRKLNDISLPMTLNQVVEYSKELGWQIYVIDVYRSISYKHPLVGTLLRSAYGFYKNSLKPLLRFFIKSRKRKD